MKKAWEVKDSHTKFPVQAVMKLIVKSKQKRVGITGRVANCRVKIKPL